MNQQKIPENQQRLPVPVVRAIETTLGAEIRYPSDCDRLSLHISDRLKETIGITTLKRLFGFAADASSPRLSTLDILARFLGYADFNDFEERVGSGERESAEVMSRRLGVEDLMVGDRVLLTWLPDRECLVEYQGDLQFRVMESKGTRLMPGDTFRCSLFIEGEPLFLDALTRPGQPPVAYVCGKRSGIRFELLN